MEFLPLILSEEVITMALTKDVKLPSDAELAVPQEITLSTPWFKAVAPYMAKHCEQQINVGLHSLELCSKPSFYYYLIL
ncbi:hypothetical protein Y032_0203g1857 [Ancylostoma ceylanicum]|uniref:Uncharacterized protein n=1 Tax=Ancylostoma ceylanicum TaxID=53326 RepID=A0A016SMW4_9BILA|nr:hypothetical protein Y032_0203g1857 [Ancylostoma ceylanicum]